MDELQTGSVKSAGLIYGLIPKVSAAIGAVAKGRKNQQQGYAFRGIDEIQSACHIPFAENGVFCVTEVIESVREERTTKNGGMLVYTIIKLRVTFFAPDGSFVMAITIGEAMDSADKSANKAMSAALKYALLQTFMIPVELDDADATTHAPMSREKPRWASEYEGSHGEQPRSQNDQPPPSPPSPEKEAFNSVVLPKIKEKRITREKVKEILESAGGNYQDALKGVIDHLEATKNNPPDTGDPL